MFQFRIVTKCATSWHLAQARGNGPPLRDVITLLPIHFPPWRIGVGWSYHEKRVDSQTQSGSAVAPPGQCPNGKLGPIGRADLLKYLTYVDFDGHFTQVQLKGDLFVHLPLAYEVHHLVLSKAETL
jgi:hypothetical protein